MCWMFWKKISFLCNNVSRLVPYQAFQSSNLFLNIGWIHQLTSENRLHNAMGIWSSLVTNMHPTTVTIVQGLEINLLSVSIIKEISRAKNHNMRITWINVFKKFNRNFIIFVIQVLTTNTLCSSLFIIILLGGPSSLYTWVFRAWVRGCVLENL